MTAMHATGRILQVAHELATTREPLSLERLKTLGKRLLEARDELRIPDPPIFVKPAPRSICLHCGAPYEEVTP